MTRGSAAPAPIAITAPMAAPHWALLERQLLDAQARACERVLRPLLRRARLPAVRPPLVRRRRPGRRRSRTCSTGRCCTPWAPDERAAPLQAGLGGAPAASTPRPRRPRCELGRDGMYYKEFHACFDWFHHGEALVALLPAGPLRPGRPGAHPAHARASPGWYMGEDPHGPQLRQRAQGHPQLLQRQPRARCCARRRRSTGPATRSRSRGASRPATASTTFEEMLDHFRDYTDVVGDNHVNLGATTLAFTAYALTGEAKYRDWVLEYVGRLGGADRAERRPHPQQRRPGRHDRERLRLVRRRLRLGLLRRCRCRATASWPTAPTTPARRTRFANALLLTGDRALRRPLAADARRWSTPTRRKRAGRRSTRTCTAGWTGWSAWSGESWTTCRSRARGLVRVPAAEVRPGGPRALLLDARPLRARPAAGDAALGALPGRRGRRLPRGGARGGPGARCAARWS